MIFLLQELFVLNKKNFLFATERTRYLEYENRIFLLVELFKKKKKVLRASPTANTTAAGPSDIIIITRTSGKRYKNDIKDTFFKLRLRLRYRIIRGNLYLTAISRVIRFFFSFLTCPNHRSNNNSVIRSNDDEDNNNENDNDNDDDNDMIHLRFSRFFVFLLFMTFFFDVFAKEIKKKKKNRRAFL